MRTAAINVLEERAETLRKELEGERSAALHHARGPLRQAEEAFKAQQGVAETKAGRIRQQEQDLREINAAINSLRGTRPIQDRPQA